MVISPEAFSVMGVLTVPFAIILTNVLGDYMEMALRDTPNTIGYVGQFPRKMSGAIHRLLLRNRGT